MNRGKCLICAKPLLDHTVLMDKDGASYHLPCWVRMMDVRLAENGERSKEARATREGHLAKARTRLAASETRMEQSQKRLDGARNRDAKRSRPPP